MSYMAWEFWALAFWASQGKESPLCRESLGLVSRGLVLIVPTWAILFFLPRPQFVFCKWEASVWFYNHRESKVQISEKKVELWEMPGLWGAPWKWIHCESPSKMEIKATKKQTLRFQLFTVTTIAWHTFRNEVNKLALFLADSLPTSVSVKSWREGTDHTRGLVWSSLLSSLRTGLTVVVTKLKPASHL